MSPQRTGQQTDSSFITGKLLFLLTVLLAAIFLLSAYSTGAEPPERSTKEGKYVSVIPYPDKNKKLSTAECMQCHPAIAKMLRTSGGRHGYVECRQCHLQVHAYLNGLNKYEEVLPKCDRCHGQPHGPELVQCSSCHQEAHTPLEIPASRALSQGCYVCHPKLSKEIKIFSTRHTDLYCTACHHTKHGTIPNCQECHQKHTGTIPASGAIAQEAAPLDQCVSCHPPHKALKVTYPDTTPNSVCSYCHRKAKEMLLKKITKHSALPCIQCHPNQHKTIKRCRECHTSTPHPDFMLKKFHTCGGCHGVAHSVVR